MNSQEIIDYVMNTPSNTNPAILKQMIEANSSGGVTSWNDLTDKPFGEKVEKVMIENAEVIPDTYVGYATLNDYLTDEYSEDRGRLFEGDSYIVRYDGVEHECVAESFYIPPRR